LSPSNPHPNPNCRYLGEFRETGPTEGPNFFPCTVVITCGFPNLSGPGVDKEVSCDGGRSCTWIETKIYDGFLCKEDCPCAGSEDGEVVKVFVRSYLTYDCLECAPKTACNCPPPTIEKGRRTIPPDR